MLELASIALPPTEYVYVVAEVAPLVEVAITGVPIVTVASAPVPVVVVPVIAALVIKRLFNAIDIASYLFGNLYSVSLQVAAAVTLPSVSVVAELTLIAGTGETTTESVG